MTQIKRVTAIVLLMLAGCAHSEKNEAMPIVSRIHTVRQERREILEAVVARWFNDFPTIDIVYVSEEVLELSIVEKLRALGVVVVAATDPRPTPRPWQIDPSLPIRNDAVFWQELKIIEKEIGSKRAVFEVHIGWRGGFQLDEYSIEKEGDRWVVKRVHTLVIT